MADPHHVLMAGERQGKLEPSSGRIPMLATDFTLSFFILPVSLSVARYNLPAAVAATTFLTNYYHSRSFIIILSINYST